MCRIFFSFSLQNQTSEVGIYAIHVPAGLLYLDYMRILFKPGVSELFGALCWTDNLTYTASGFGPEQIHKPTKDSMKPTL